MSKEFIFLILNLVVQYVTLVSATHFINEWAVEIKGGPTIAKRVAADHGYEVIDQIRGFDDNYLLRHKDVASRSKRSADHHTKRLTSDSRVEWADQQFSKSRVKRGYLEDIDLETRQVNFAHKREDENKVYRETSFSDPLWPSQWYLHDERENLAEPKKDLHVIPLWNRGLSGKGVTVSILDDGLEYKHEDLIDNYAPEASYDFNNKDPDPTPRYDPTNENKHGTRCAGEVAMKADNDKCGVGVAFNAKIGGIKILDGTVTDTLEGEALQFAHDKIDIYSASWGPNDDGHTVEGPGRLATQAFKNGVTKGRNGKGVIYVWASGNGGRLYDNCDCDGYTGSIYTLSISSASQTFKKPWYGELCASTMGTTYSSGSAVDNRVISTDLNNTCTSSHTGTSAAAPLAAGIIALLLEANPNLTWRDVQHLVTWTSQVEPLRQNKDDHGWVKNGAGFLVNTAFGFGILDGTGLVDAAKDWQKVPAQSACEVVVTKDSNLPQALKSNQTLEIEINTSGCKGQANEVNYIEHVQLKLTLDYTKRGAVSVYLISPSNTSTMLLSERPYDKSTQGFKSWPLMSVHNWGEDPTGKWKVVLEDTTNDKNTGIVKDLKLVIHGTKEQPQHMKNGPRTYIRNYNHVQNKEKPEKSPESLINGETFLKLNYLRDSVRGLKALFQGM
ncbi:hypothetical protein SNE40_012095 [Patella caerulea]|uniref:P/Homo B domain-containing protein n=1 Tax=Patella caerulea TaxID=87958 RepID=A0AAN8JRL4_PATCE